MDARAYPFVPNIIRFATKRFANGRQSSALSAAARPVPLSQRQVVGEQSHQAIGKADARIAVGAALVR